MNPLTNRWAALFAVAAVLLIVSELVGTGENGGMLSQAAGTNYAANGEALPPGVVQVVGPTVDAAEQTNPEDEPQVVMPDSPDVVDAEDAPPEEIEEPEIDPDVIEEPVIDDSGEEFTNDSAE